jgi:hypothetical protein
LFDLVFKGGIPVEATIEQAGLEEIPVVHDIMRQLFEEYQVLNPPSGAFTISNNS